MQYEEHSRSVWNWTDLGRREPEFVDTFRHFWRLLLECRQKATALNSSAVPLDSQTVDVEAIQTDFLEAFKHQRRVMSRESGPYGEELSREIEYVEAVLADEVFLTLEWPGRKFWANHLLEAHLFGTHTAGETFFTRIDEFLADRHTGPEGLELLYFLALSLGFQGKYRNRQDRTSLSRYKRELYRRYYSTNPTGVQSIQYAFPACYEHTLDSFIPRQLPSPTRWLAILLAAILTWAIVTQILWSGLTGELLQQMKAIQSTSSLSSSVADGK